LAELKTKKTGASVSAFLNGLADPEQREDARRVLALMKKVTGLPPRMWGPSIVGFGSYRYRYPSGREAEWFLTGFSPRKGNLTFYLMPGIDRYRAILKGLGKHKTGKGCLYVKRLDDVDLGTLRKLVKTSVADAKNADKMALGA
jgi:hypothetical protein